MIETVLSQTAGSNLSITPSFMRVSIDGLIGTVTTWVFIVAGVVAFFYLIFSGFTYLTAGGNPDAAKKGMQGILNAVIGLVIIALAYGIVSAVVGMLNTNTTI